MRDKRVYYVSLSAFGHELYKVGGICPNAEHAAFYKPHFEQNGLHERPEHGPFRVAILDQYQGDRLTEPQVWLHQLQALPIVGNAHDDQQRLQLSDDIINHAKATDEQKIEALRELDRTIGEVRESVTMDDVNQFLFDSHSDFGFTDDVNELLDFASGENCHTRVIDYRGQRLNVIWRGEQDATDETLSLLLDNAN